MLVASPMDGTVDSWPCPWASSFWLMEEIVDEGHGPPMPAEELADVEFGMIVVTVVDEAPLGAGTCTVVGLEIFFPAGAPKLDCCDSPTFSSGFRRAGSSLKALTRGTPGGTAVTLPGTRMGPRVAPPETSRPPATKDDWGDADAVEDIGTPAVFDQAAGFADPDPPRGSGDIVFYFFLSYQEV